MLKFKLMYILNTLTLKSYIIFYNTLLYCIIMYCINVDKYIQYIIQKYIYFFFVNNESGVNCLIFCLLMRKESVYNFMQDRDIRRYMRSRENSKRLREEERREAAASQTHPTVASTAN